MGLARPVHGWHWSNLLENTMTQTELDSFRDQLRRLAARLTHDFSQLEGEALRKTDGEASGNLSSVPIHMADLGTDNYEEEITLGLLENADATLEEISAALTRLDRDTFGDCEECHKPIGKERLHAIPYTRYCVECARKVEG
jgi:RNA polymerase-binding transcription factor DksA